jgi:hypothetical protein
VIMGVILDDKSNTNVEVVECAKGTWCHGQV